MRTIAALPGNALPNGALPGSVFLSRLFLSGLFLSAALLPVAAEAQVLDTTRVAPGSTDYAIETYFVKIDTTSFFKPHEDRATVRRLIERSGRGRCRILTLLRAVRQRNAAAVGRRYDGEAVNVRLLLRCGPPRSAAGTERPTSAECLTSAKRSADVGPRGLYQMLRINIQVLRFLALNPAT
jgi:hypothetical protein